MVEKSTGRKLKAIRTDNGGEFTSKEFEAHLTREGVRHELTVPKTPEQNGVAERMNRTLVETARSMLIHANLPHRFWAEALSTATYLRNRSSTKAVCGILLMKPGQEKNRELMDFEFSGGKPSYTYPRMKERSWSESLGSVFS